MNPQTAVEKIYNLKYWNNFWNNVRLVIDVHSPLDTAYPPLGREQKTQNPSPLSISCASWLFNLLHRKWLCMELFHRWPILALRWGCGSRNITFRVGCYYLWHHRFIHDSRLIIGGLLWNSGWNIGVENGDHLGWLDRFHESRQGLLLKWYWLS